jgi:hypothetical protein
MDTKSIDTAVAAIAAENDPALKCLKMASLCSAIWAARGVQLVVVGGSAIEILTEGAYTSGDLDLCHVSATSLTLRERQEIMGLLGGKGGPRRWEVAGMFVDLLGAVESFARTPYRRVEAPYGEVLLMKPEDLLVERVLVAFYPGENLTALDCAKKLISAALGEGVAMDWSEVRRLAYLPEYRNFVECAKLVEEVANEFKVESPLHPD